MTAAVAALDMPAEGCGAAQLDRSHRLALHGGKRRAMQRPIGLTIAAEYLRDLWRVAGHCGRVQAGAGAASPAAGGAARRPSSGLAVAQTLWVASRSYRAVVFRLRWPSSSWMVRRSAPLSSRCTAKAWRNACGVTGLPMPCWRRMMRQVSSTADGVIGCPGTSPGNSHSLGRAVRQ